MNKVKVVNLPIIKICRCGNWFQHWKNFGHQFIRNCPVENCSFIDIEGTHVQKTESEDSNIYIIPLCKKHAASSEVLDIIPSLNFVLADVALTCGEGSASYEQESVL